MNIKYQLKEKTYLDFYKLHLDRFMESWDIDAYPDIPVLELIDVESDAQDDYLNYKNKKINFK